MGVIQRFRENIEGVPFKRYLELEYRSRIFNIFAKFIQFKLLQLKLCSNYFEVDERKESFVLISIE